MWINVIWPELWLIINTKHVTDWQIWWSRVKTFGPQYMLIHINNQKREYQGYHNIQLLHLLDNAILPWKLRLHQANSTPTSHSSSRGPYRSHISCCSGVNVGFILNSPPPEPRSAASITSLGRQPGAAIPFSFACAWRRGGLGCGKVSPSWRESCPFD